MMFIEDGLNSQPFIGGVVDYHFLVNIIVVHVYQGYVETSISRLTLDFTPWLLLVLVISTIVTIRQQLNSNQTNG